MSLGQQVVPTSTTCGNAALDAFKIGASRQTLGGHWIFSPSAVVEGDQLVLFAVGTNELIDVTTGMTTAGASGNLKEQFPDHDDYREVPS